MVVVDELDTWAVDCSACGQSGFVATPPHSGQAPEACPFCGEHQEVATVPAYRRLLLRVEVEA